MLNFLNDRHEGVPCLMMCWNLPKLNVIILGMFIACKIVVSLYFNQLFHGGLKYIDSF